MKIQQTHTSVQRPFTNKWHQRGSATTGHMKSRFKSIPGRPQTIEEPLPRTEMTPSKNVAET